MSAFVPDPSSAFGVGSASSNGGGASGHRVGGVKRKFTQRRRNAAETSQMESHAEEEVKSAELLQARELPPTPPTPPSPPPPPPPAPQVQTHIPQQPSLATSPHNEKQTQQSSFKRTCKYYDTRVSNAATHFTWDLYLELEPAEPAPREAFRQPQIYPKNMFILGMCLEAKDPRSESNWSLATVVNIEGLMLRLRFVGTDAMNDLYELIDSDNIRPYGEGGRGRLLPPAGFTGNIGNYCKYVDKYLTNKTIAEKDIFPEKPRAPPRNLFKVGMKLEAVDRKNRDFICPATVGKVEGDKIGVTFDGWRGSFDYECKYTSRDIFPINWCRDVGRTIQPPNGWSALLKRGPRPPQKEQSPNSKQARPSFSPLSTMMKKHSGKLTKSSEKAKLKNRGRAKGSKNLNKSNETKKALSFSPKTKKNSLPSEPLRDDRSKKIATDHSFYTKIDSSDELDDDIDAEIDVVSDDQDDNSPIENPYRCQRTIPFHDWRVTKYATHGV